MWRFAVNMAASTAFDRLYLRLKVLYVLVAFLYIGLLLDFYLTVRVVYLIADHPKSLVFLEGRGGSEAYTPNFQNPIVAAAATAAGASAPARAAANNTSATASAQPEGGGRALESERRSSLRVSSAAATFSYEQRLSQVGETASNERKSGTYAGTVVHPFKRRRRNTEDDSTAEDDVEKFRGFGGDDHGRSESSSSEVSADQVARVKRRAWRRARQYPPPEDSGEPSVEFFPNPQPTQETDGYVWLTSYSRIPLEVLKEFCFSTKEYCPPGDRGPPGTPGTPGFKGEKGDRGDRGLPGEPGPKGPEGYTGKTGPFGPKGEAGKSGIPGLDGRDGIPGEPGLDGVPGRDGIDGISGRDGIPGIPGTPGRPGTNGTNGIPGSPGPRGPPGPPGPTGLPGPRGRKGVPGKPGAAGVPGIKAWTVNGTETSTLLIPPSIIDTEQQTTLMVDEGHNVRLKCAATGTPTPQVKWRSDENKPIYLRSWQQSSVQDDVLEINRVSRDHMGVYMCIASNGVPPPAYMKIKLEVAFPPLIKIRNQMVGTVNGSAAVLECFVEAYPSAVNYWLHGDGRMVEPTWKFKMNQKDDGYHTHMILNISYIEPLDYGLYKCVSKNDKGKTLGVFTVFEIDPNTPTRKPPVEQQYEVYGQPPPPPLFDDTSCEPCPTKCDPPPFCPSSGQVGSPDISRVYSVFVPNATFLTPPRSRKDNCMIHQLGKPVFQRSSSEEQGTWMQDSFPSDKNEGKYYITLSTDTNHLLEYQNREDFRNKTRSIKRDLPYDFSGNAHVVYNGSFYFHKARTNLVIRFDIANNSSLGETIADAAFLGNAYLYSTEISYMDLAADENGLWVIYSSIHSNNTLVRKLHPYTLDTQYIWNITLNHRNVGDMFIACGVLYAVNSVTVPNTQITFAFDLYQNELLDINIGFSNPFRGNTMIAYNPKHRKIYTWDKGNLLVYPLLFGTIDMGQPEVLESEGDKVKI